MAEESGWLIERRIDGVPHWASFDQCGVEWTTDSLKACRFARREDAEQMAYGEDCDAITEHLWLDNEKAPTTSSRRPWDEHLDPDEGNDYRDFEAWEKWMRARPDIDGELAEVLAHANTFWFYGKIALYGIMDDLCEWGASDD